MSGGWVATTIGEVLELQRGYDITRSQQQEGTVPVVSSGGISSFHSAAMSEGPGVVIGRKGTLGKVFYLPGSYWPHDTTLWVRDFKGSFPRFVYYFFRTLDFGFLDVGSANPTLNRNHVHPLAVRWPALREQRAIAEVLGALDDKIAANDHKLEVVRGLENALYQLACVDSRTSSVGDVAEFLNRRRVPLSSRERAARRGKVPYYGAAGQIDMVNEALFNEPIVLIGEDGTVQTDAGKAVVQYVWGSSWVNNHAHVLVGQGVSTDVLRVALRGLSVADAVTGAVQPKLSMARLRSLPLPVPTGDRLTRLDGQLTALGAVVREATEESRALTALRDTLLPELMSGRMRVKDAETTVEGVL